MQKSKAKPEGRWLGRALLFIILWTLGELAMRAVTNAFIASELYRGPLSAEQINIIHLLLYMLTWTIQIQLVERLLKRSMRYWMLYNLIAALLTLFLGNQVVALVGGNTDLMRILIPVVFLAPALIQTIWFWPRVHKAGLWLITGALIILSRNLVFAFARPGDVTSLTSLIEIVAPVITGGLMVYLWSHPRTTEKAKIDQAAAASAEHERLERLQDRDHERSNPLWDRGDEQALQSEA